MSVTLDPGAGVSAAFQVPSGEGSSGPSTELKLEQPNAPVGRKSQKRRRSFGGSFGLFAPAIAAAIVGTLFFTNPASAQSQRAQQGVTVQTSPIEIALQWLAAADKDGNQRLNGGRIGNELEGIDPLARAVFDYVNYVNPSGSMSLWGPTSRGDYSEGGLGLGYTLRPKHMTMHGYVPLTDLAKGAREIEQRLAAEPNDQVAADIAAIGKIMPGAIHTAAEELLVQIQKLTEAKELATKNSQALLTEAELLAALPDGLMKEIAKAAQGHGPVFFAKQLEAMETRRGELNRALGTDLGPRVEVDVVGEAQQHYILLISKRAKELELLSNIRDAM